MEIFISHIAEEKHIALKLKEWLETTFLDTDIFVSSDPQDLKAGEKWLKIVENELVESRVLIIVCSTKSLTKPWIYFEAGAGWIKKVPVIPICHSGIKASNIPQPLSNFQALDMLSSDFSKILLSNISEHLGYKRKPRTNFQRMQQELLEELEVAEDKDLGLYDHFVLFEEGFKELTNLINRVGDETNSIKIKTNSFREKFKRSNTSSNQKESTAIYLRKITKDFSEEIRSYAIEIKQINERYSDELEKVEDSTEYILENVEINNKNDRQNVEKFLEGIKIMKNSSSEARSTFSSLSQTLDSFPNIQKNLSKANDQASQEILNFVELIDDTIDMAIKVEGLIDNLLKKAS